MKTSTARAALLALAVAALPARAQKITEFPIGDGAPVDITVGADGALYLTDYTNRLVRMRLDGGYDKYKIATAGAGPWRIISTPRGGGVGSYLFFTQMHVDAVGAVSLDGNDVDELPGGFPGIVGITAGPDGRLWFAQDRAEGGRLVAYPNLVNSPGFLSYPTPSQPRAIALGPDDRIWYAGYTESVVAVAGGGRQALGPPSFTDYIGVCSPTVSVFDPLTTCTEYPVPTYNAKVVDIAAGPDGNLWFTEQLANKVGRITPGGTITEFPVPTPSSSPTGITAGPDGNVWFVEAGGSKIGRITPSGVITEYPTPTANSLPINLTAGPDGNIWFTEYSAGKIGRLRIHVPGDAEDSGTVDVSDVLYLINFLFASGPAPK